jgi:mannonate dehydratase
VIQIAELFDPGDAGKMQLAVQAGVTHAIGRVVTVLKDVPCAEYAKALAAIRCEFNDAGLVFAGVESHPVPAEKIKLGLPGRDGEIENYIAVIRALAENEVPLLCYNWMAGLGWYRTSVDLLERGGALVSEFSQEEAQRQGLTEFGEVSEETIWANLEYFLKAVMPVAEECGVAMALHPDDPPISPLRGIGRILTSADAFRRVIALHPGPSNCITFCQANFQLMGEDIEALVRDWCADGRIRFVHLRDVTGTRERFRETFHDNGPTNLAAMLKLYHEAGFTGPMRPDHAPTMRGEANDRPGYAMQGKILAIGYMKGAMDALGIPFAKQHSTRKEHI